MAQSPFYALFSDIGGVLGTNGWDSRLRQKIATHFGVEHERIDARHHLMFDSFERGYLSFDEYLRTVFFAEPRSFSLEQLREFTFEESVAWPANIELLKRVKRANRLKVGLISNEGGSLAQYRIGKFGLLDVADFVIVSHFVHHRKPDPQMWQLALNLVNAEPTTCIYIDDREIFVDVAKRLGFTAFQHTSLENTREELRRLGLATE